LLRERVRGDRVLRAVLDSCLEELEEVLNALRIPYVVESDVRVDTAEWITGGQPRTRYILTVRAPDLSIEERLNLWRDLSNSLQPARARVVSKLARPPRIRAIDLLNNVMVHMDLRA
jgi:hypothetical protein